ncbi:3-hydroxybenzoate 6-hydroxylase 1 [Cytospora mali]|uniref:3-hydroxybenzoate 6-hydroxylase 1 n=1 Tax=Cytospora mali TaxID=578113 RepID=A0A194VPB0_CYTMA|nr:3-hydroxybenzoate 6-hydroxylase 1 [Valsa mali]QZJ85035.1 Hbh4 [Valsa mali]
MTNLVNSLNGAGPSPNKVGPTSPLVDDYPTPLKIIVVGAGVGGLSAALSLRRNGHQVEIYEQSRFANETGAAVHLAPNSNGVLRRWGIYAEEFGATPMDRLQERNEKGDIIKDIDLRGMKGQWQHPWLLSHRVYLHEKLKAFATGEDGIGSPAKLQTSSKVVSVNPEKGEVTLADGTTVTGDVVLGADGIYSKSRTYIKDAKLFRSGKAAFRFLIPRKAGLDDPVTKSIVEDLSSLGMWYGSDRRIVMYPCNDNQLLNFVCIHPDTESHDAPGDEWNKQGDVERIMKVYKDFDPAVLALIRKVDPATVKVWQLMDMEKLPTWTEGKLALLGDAAHPFTPHQGQGAGQAIEDAAALSVVLPRGTSPDAVPERLKLYEKIRYTRAHQIQEYSRLAGKDWVDGKPQIDMMAYTAYNFGHDEIDNSNNVFKRWKWSLKPNMYWRMPTAFGPFPGPRQDGYGRALQEGLQRTFTTISVKFKTSRTYLETLFPNSSFRFKSPSTVCQASISITELGKMQWLGGNGYRHLGLYIHGVEYVKKDGSTIAGTYMPVLFESLTDPISSGREELGMPKLFCDVDIHRRTSSVRVAASWRGAKFVDLSLTDLEEDDVSSEHGTIGGEADYGILVYRYIPAVGEPGVADCEYAVVVPHEEEQPKATVKKVFRAPAGQGKKTGAKIEIDALDWEALPTLHHVARALAEVPIYEVVGAKVVEGTGVPDVSAARRIE